MVVLAVTILPARCGAIGESVSSVVRIVPVVWDAVAVDIGTGAIEATVAGVADDASAAVRSGGEVEELALKNTFGLFLLLLYPAAVVLAWSLVDGLEGLWWLAPPPNKLHKPRPVRLPAEPPGC
uniref:Uncharacterized protein n=1 Tax=Anopheles melas TaxID=34690 RepID=A0A182U5X2_9DIPT